MIKRDNKPILYDGLNLSSCHLIKGSWCEQWIFFFSNGWVGTCNREQIYVWDGTWMGGKEKLGQFLGTCNAKRQAIKLKDN